MKQFKRVIAFVIAAVMMMSFASCSMVEETDITNDNIKIGVILKNNKETTTGNTGYAMSAINEVLGLGYGIGEERFGYTVVDVNPDNADSVSAALTELINKECNLIIATENGYLDDIQKVSGDNEAIKFFVCDADNDGKNIYGYKADMTETMYFTGIVAGMKAAESKDKKVGFVAADKNNDAMVNAFAKGVNAVAPDAAISVVYSTDANAAATKLAEAGCVVLASDYEDEAIAKVAVSKKIAFCGFGSETYYNAVNEETGEKLYADAFLCAPLYNYTQFYVDAIKAVVDNREPAPFVGGYAEGATYLSDINETLAAEGTQEAYEKAVAQFESGELKLDEVSVANVTVI